MYKDGFIEIPKSVTSVDIRPHLQIIILRTTEKDYNFLQYLYLLSLKRKKKSLSDILSCNLTYKVKLI